MLEDKLQLADQGLTQSSAKAQNPAQIKLVYKDSGKCVCAVLILNCFCLQRFWSGCSN